MPGDNVYQFCIARFDARSTARARARASRSRRLRPRADARSTAATEERSAPGVFIIGYTRDRKRIRCSRGQNRCVIRRGVTSMMGDGDFTSGQFIEAARRAASNRDYRAPSERRRDYGFPRVRVKIALLRIACEGAAERERGRCSATRVYVRTLAERHECRSASRTMKSCACRGCDKNSCLANPRTSDSR
jgi:hypothetical protein